MAKNNTEARVLLDHDGFRINSVITGDDAERAIAEGWGDGDPDAVAYAKSLTSESKKAEQPAK